MSDPVEEGGAGRKAESRWNTPGSVVLFVAGFLLLFTLVSIATGRPGRVGYGAGTLAASVLLAAFGAGMRRGISLCVYLAGAFLAGLALYWGLGLFRGLDMGLTLWTVICLVTLREVASCGEWKSLFRR